MQITRKKIAIVGCGWLGSSLAEFYVKQGNEVAGTTRTPSKAETLNQIGVEGHILNSFEDDLSWLKTADILVLNIPPSSFGEEYPNFMVHIARQLTETARVLFISSTSVYDNRNLSVNENEVALGNSSRGKTVYQAEKELEKLLGKRLTTIRMAGLVGKERHPAKYMSGKVYPGQEEPINLIHLTDCIGLIEAVIKKEAWGEVFNGCAEVHPQKGEYYPWAARKLNVTPPEFTNETVPFKTVSNEKSRVVLGYSYRYADPFDFPI